MVSYCAGHQPLNRLATPFSTSRKVLQSYNHFPKLTNFSQKKLRQFLFEKYAVYRSKLCDLRVKSMGVRGQNYGTYVVLASLWLRQD